MEWRYGKVFWMLWVSKRTKVKNYISDEKYCIRRYAELCIYFWVHFRHKTLRVRTSEYIGVPHLGNFRLYTFYSTSLQDYYHVYPFIGK